jgi:hypothetical protein
MNQILQKYMDKLVSRKYKNKYISIKDIYDKIKKDIKVKGTWCKTLKRHRNNNISYKLFYNIVKRFFEILARDLIIRKQLIHLPLDFGYIYLDKKEHKRAFHYRLDHEETNKTGMPVIYKVPILDDYYYKIIWKRPLKYAKCKIMPLTYFKKFINDKK